MIAPRVLAALLTASAVLSGCVNEAGVTKAETTEAGAAKPAVAKAATEQPAEKRAEKITYNGIETILLDDDLVNFRLAMTGGKQQDLEAYARCAVARYAQIRGYGYARHIRTNVVHDSNRWNGDVVYVISAELPRGLKLIKAGETLAECEKLEIPTV